MDFNVEEYQKRQEARRQKDLAVQRKKNRNQIIGASLIFLIVGFVLSTTEMGCDFIQRYIDGEVKTYLDQAQKAANVEPEFFYPEDDKIFQSSMKQNFEGSHLITLQNYVCNMNLFFSRSYRTYKSFNKLRIYFGGFFPERIPEILYREIAAAKDSGQFKDCGMLIEYFYYKYGEKLQTTKPWDEKIHNVEINWKLINASKRDTNEFVY